MALWNSLGQGAIVAQLAGMDATGLISMIVQAVENVKRNKVRCQQLVNDVMVINDLLQLLHQSDTMQRPEIRRPLVGLEDTLRQAYVLVSSCQKSSVMYCFMMARSQAQQFRDVRERIDSFLRIYPLISHIDTRSFITESGTGRSSAENQASQEMLGSFTGHLNPDSRNKESTSSDNGVESVEVQAVTEPVASTSSDNGLELVEVQAVTEPVADEVQQNDEVQAVSEPLECWNAEVIPKRKHRLRWLLLWIRNASATQALHRLIDHEETGLFTIFKFSQLAACTNNFSSHNIIRLGGSGGPVFKGVLPNGVNVAAKINSTESFQGISEFRSEVLIIPKLQHANIIKLLGCCIEGNNRILVYEYLCNGSLDRTIHEPRAGVSLSWPIRFRIIEGIVQGALYLHHHSRPHVLHRDLKLSNIVLNSDMTPKITDFGLALLLNSEVDEMEATVAGTVAYLDPEYLLRGVVTIKSDVYAFGVMLLEIITSRRPLSSTEQEHLRLVEYAWELWSSGRTMELIDPSLKDEPGISDILRCIHIALLCVQQEWEDRPTMSDVLIMLKCESMTLPVPRR